jgi:hypothetical protein
MEITIVHKKDIENTRVYLPNLYKSENALMIPGIIMEEPVTRTSIFGRFIGS